MVILCILARMESYMWELGKLRRPLRTGIGHVPRKNLRINPDGSVPEDNPLPGAAPATAAHLI